MHCEGPGVADWFKESTITTRSLYSFNLLKCSDCSLERSLCLDCGCERVWMHPAVVSKGLLHNVTFSSGLIAEFLKQRMMRNYAKPKFLFWFPFRS